jgi:hypothetical protein
MDTLALGIIAIGVVAAIGVVLVAVNSGDSDSSASAAAKEAAKPQAEQSRARPRARRKQQAIPRYAASQAPQHNGYVTGPQDPLVAGFMQVVSTELQSLRQEQDKIDQRLKLINGIAELMHDMQGSSVNGSDHITTAANHTASRG